MSISSVLAERMMMGTAEPLLRTSRQTSKPEMSGSITSSRIRSGRLDSDRYRPSLPFSASTTS